MENRILANEIPLMVGEEVLVKGWVWIWRELKNMHFLILRDRTGYCQVFIPKGVVQKSISPESTLIVNGVVHNQPQSKYSGVEIVASQIEVISEAEVLPFPINREEGSPPFNTLNIFRPVTLRRESERAIFKIQAEILTAWREFFNSKGFTEIQSTKLSNSGLEGGAEMFQIEYFGEKMFLTQSPQFYKQMMVGAFERVFEVGKVYRAEGSNSNKHLTEFIGLDFELGFIQSFEEIMSTEEEALSWIFNHLNVNCREELNHFGIGELKINPIPRITYSEAIQILESVGHTGGLNSEGERIIGEWVANRMNSEFVFITKYPLSERPFYSMPSKEEGLSETFDLLWKGVEITSGGQRIHKFGELVNSMEVRGMNPELFGSYLMPFKWGMPPHGGGGIGLERILKQMLNLNSAEEASLIPRTREKFIH